MPKREGVDALGLPHSVSRNSRPGSSGVGAAAATTLSRPGLYSLGGTLAANSSSSLVGGRFHHVVAGPTTPANAAASSSEPNLLAAAGQSYSGPVPAAEAPHLSSTEAFFGRMTLTAPDNMRRRKAEEKEKKKQARRRRAEKGAAAAANIIGAAPSLVTAGTSNPTTLGSVGAIGTPVGHAAALDSTLATRQKQRRRPALPTSNSTSNLHLYTLEQSRSRSPTRPARPHSAQTNHQPSHEHGTSSNSDRQTEARRRAGSDGSDNRAILQRPESSNASAAAPVYSSSQSQRLDDALRQSSAAGPSVNDIITDAPLSHATQRRGDIYADLEAMGLPGANESDLEDQPPPFPSHATRPISPPRMPAEGEEWTEEMRRRQEEYEMNRPPDSPPPAFRSEDEGRSSRRERSISSDVSLSDHDSIVEPATQERREWEDDLAAGFTLEERIQRDRARRLLQEKEAQPTEIAATAMNQSLERPTQEAEEAEPPTPLDLGRLVKEARARRGMAEALARQSLEEATPALPASSSAPLDLAARRPSDSMPRIPSEPLASTSHNFVQATVRTPGREAAAGVALPIPKKAKIVRRKKKVAIPTKQGGRSEDVSDPAMKTTKAEPGQSIQSTQTQNSTRFRDGASAAAARRMALWGVTTDGAGTIQALEPVLRPSLVSQSVSEGDLPAILDPQASHAAVPSFAAPPLLRSDTAASSTSGGLASSIEGEAEGSSDSDEAWNKEDAAFEAMQSKLAPAVVDDESSDEEGSRHPPGWLRSNSIDLARPGSNVPKAPPPLALGRSRGGIDEYSSSSSSSSSGESLARRMADDSDDDSLSPADARDSQMNLRSSSGPEPHKKGMDKGKAPVRPTSLDTSQSLSAPETTTSSLLDRAGQFEEDSGSSHDFDTGDDDYEAPFGKLPRQESKDSTLRRPVSKRLKGLFSTPLSASEEASLRLSATSRASMERLMDPDMGITNAQADARRVSAREEKELPWDEPMRARERAIALAALEAKKGAMTTEQQARLDALEEIANLQRASAAEPSSSAAGINQHSLVALEKLLSRRSYAGQGQSTAGLTRSGAIHRPEVAAPFVNPRSSIAPRPLGRLPTITSDTRHFPPSRTSTIVSSGRSGSTTSGSPALPFAQSRRSVMGTPNWMTHIPSSEKRALPDPLEPVKRYSASSMNPPALPPRPAGNRVSAMVERFEGQMGNEIDVSHGSSRVSSEDAVGPIPSSDRDHALRRRPPPPPPSSRGRHQRGTFSSLSRPPSVSQSGNEAALAGEIDQQDAAMSNDSSMTPAAGVNALTSNAGQLSELISAARNDSPVLAPTSAFPRSRSRPLPIPPIMPSSSRPAPSPEPTENGNDTEEAEDETADDEEAPQSNESPNAVSLQSTEATPRLPPPNGPDRRAPSLGFTDLDLFASRLADQAPADGTNYDDLHLLSEFLGPAKPTGATAEEVEALSVGVVEVLRKRVVGRRENGKDKVRLVLNVMGVKVERCGVCLVQFKEGNMACVFPCLHVLHEDCARRLLRSTKLCPTCRVSIA